MSSGFGAMAGLLFVPGIVERRTEGLGSASGSALRASMPWGAAAALTSLIFVVVLGRGIPLGHG
jgi:hypothetical protein